MPQSFVLSSESSSNRPRIFRECLQRGGKHKTTYGKLTSVQPYVQLTCGLGEAPFWEYVIISTELFFIQLLHQVLVDVLPHPLIPSLEKSQTHFASSTSSKITSTWLT